MMINDSFINRVKDKARSNELSIVVGSRFSDDFSLPRIAKELQARFKFGFTVKSDYEYFTKWNEFINTAEKAAKRETILDTVTQIVASAEIGPFHRKLASIPISNFVDITLDRRFVRALKESGKVPIIHNFGSQYMGSWRQSNSENPNVFYSFIELGVRHTWFGLHEQLCLNPQNRIQIENMMEMVRQKDILLLGLSPQEAEDILHLPYLAQAADKIVNTEDPTRNYHYWAKLGVYVADISTNLVIEYLVPYDLKSYTLWDSPFPNRMLIDVTKEKEYDCFISYFTGDQPFARKIEADLRNRDLHIWRDEREIDIGNSISDMIQDALKKSYTFLIVLSPEALERPWVKEELRAAYNLRLAEDLKILPVVYKECEIPVFLMDYRFADFREEKKYSEQIQILSRSIHNAVKRARRKK